jgi:arylsulfatase A-like enzyme
MRLAVLSVLLAAPAAAADRPNVVFVCTDDQRADTVAALGNPDIRTPELDALVARGTAFTRAYCQGSMQPAVCVPSRAMFLSGRSLFRVNEQLKGVPTWPEVFRKAGYHAVGVGKWHNGPESYARSFDAGGPVFFGGMGDQNKVPVHAFNPEGKYPKADLKTGTEYSTKLFADAAVDFLKAYRGEKPFFLYVTFTAPHDPRTPHPDTKGLYDPARMKLPKNFLPKHPFDNGELLVRDEKLLGWPRPEADVRRELADYYAMITYISTQVGRLGATLKDRGFDKSTLVIFTSDSGLALGSHGLLGKQSLYEHSMRAPLIVAGPGVPAGKTSDAFAYLYDIFPTVCDLCGVKPPDGVEGKSLVPVMTGKAEKVRDAVFGAYRSVQRSVRTDGWKLIRYPHINRTQLFDLKADPDETADLAGDPKHAARVEELTKLLAEQQKAFGDSLPLTSAKPGPEQIELPPKG